MQHKGFMILTGHLDDYPLSVLFSILRHQRKTGRLLIEYPMHPANFYFKDGDLIDAQLNTLNGLQAACVAFSLPNAPFNFNPLIKPTGRSIDNPSQKAILELLGCWEEQVFDARTIVESEATPSLPTTSPTVALNDAHQAILVEPQEVLALPAAASGDSSEIALTSPPPPPLPEVSEDKRHLLLTSAVALLIGLPVVVLALSFGRSNKQPFIAPPVQSTAASAVESPSAKSSESANNTSPDTLERNSTDPNAVHVQREDQMRAHHQNRELFVSETNRSDPAKKDSPSASAAVTPVQNNVATPAIKNTATSETVKKLDHEANSNGQAVKVVLQIENGRVLQASVANRRPGMEAYEALALRIARQRRYPSNTGGQETMLIKVGPQQ